MGALSYLRGVYDLDTLDTRFTTPATVPYKAVIDARRHDARNGSANGGAGQEDIGLSKPDKRAQPSKWNTPEFYLYYLAFVTLVPYMFWIAYDVSRPSDPRYGKFESLLEDGWIPGRKIDNSDAQYHGFRKNIPYIGLLLVLHPLCRQLWNSFFPMTKNGHEKEDGRLGPEIPDARLNQRLSFDYVFALLYLAALHGFSAIKVLAILWVNFNIGTMLPRKYVPVATWVFNVGILFANELCEGYRFEAAAQMFSATTVRNASDPKGGLVALGAWLDSYGGLQPRWEVLFNITILRLISFNMDRYWAQEQRSASPVEKKQLDPANLSEKERVKISAQSSDFSFRNYIAYAVYAPLYLAGPILTFNDYISQSRYRPLTIETSRTIRYGVRFVLCLLAMELVLHYDYVGAISKASPDWNTYTPAQLSMLSFFNLHIIWLKLLIPWRLFRLWSLVDGIDPPENMLRCVSDNYSTLSFWRAWHRSYNRWLVRYLFVPLGGADFRTAATAVRSAANYILVFTFVALWHDIQLRLLIWGWLVVFFFLPEVFATLLFPARKWASRPTAYRMLCCVGAVGNVLMMMAANLVGFAIGLDGLQSILRAIFHDVSGLVFLVIACSGLFVGIQVMFEIRQSELRRGIKLNC